MNKEEFAGNSVGSGVIAGVGIESPSLPNQAEPGIKKKKTFEVIKRVLRRNER